MLFMALQPTGYVVLRAASGRIGLALCGLAAGFASSTGTIAALGARAREAPALHSACVAGTLFSTVATVVLLGIVVLAVFRAALGILAATLACALSIILLLASVNLLRSRGKTTPAPSPGRAFNLLYAIGFAALLMTVTTAVSLVSRYVGDAAAGVTAAVAGAF